MTSPHSLGSDAIACPTCPVCRGAMELVYERFNQQVCVCRDCQAGITIPSSALEIARLKREGKWKTEP